MIRRHVISFGHAFDGLLYAIKTQPNFSVHLTIAFIVVLVGLYFRLSGFEWALIWLTISLGLVIELINTAIESVVDLATDKWHHHAKIAKDVAASAMLVYAIGSFLVAIFIFIPKL